MTLLPTWQSCATWAPAMRKHLSPTTVIPPPAAQGAEIDGDAFPDRALLADPQFGILSAIAKRLGRSAEHGERVNDSGAADRRASLHDDMREQADAALQPGHSADDASRPDLGIAARRAPSATRAVGSMRATTASLPLAEACAKLRAHRTGVR